MQASIQSIIKHIGLENIEPGDIYIANNPYLGGTHLPDITLCKPIFYNSEIIAFVANRAHHADVGGKVPGSMPSGAYSLDEEGFVIDPVAIEKKGQFNEEWFNNFLSNVRVPKERKGDLKAQLAATKVGEQKYIAIIKKYSLELVNSVISFLKERSRIATISLIRNIPHNKLYTFTDYMDNDGVSDEPVPITAEVKRKGDEIIIDYSKTADQTVGNINAPRAVTLSATYYIFRCLVPLEYATNCGLYEPIKVITRSGSLLDPKYPAGVAAGNVETSQRIVDVMLGVFSKIFPNEITAASAGTMNNLIIGGKRDDGADFTYYETIAGGIGAGKNYHPPNARHSHMTNTRNTSIEVLERYYPLRVHEYSIIRNSGGKGRWNGSCGIRRSIELLAEKAILSIQSERRIFAPFGLFGGESGTKGENWLIRGGEKILLKGKVTREIMRGDIVVVNTPGGGGYGKKN